jgi:EF hand
MNKYVCSIMISGSLTASVFLAAQEPGEGRRATPKAAAGNGLVARMMKYDKNKDGKLQKSEVTDQRLKRLFDQADADKDGTLSKEELTAFAAKEQSKAGLGRGGGPGGFGPPGGGPGGDGPPGFGGPGGAGMGGPPRPGEILPRFLRERLELSAEQEKQIQDLQKEVDAKLEKILSAEQREQLKEMRSRGPGGFGPRGPGGPGGPPEGEGGFPPPPPEESE